MEISESTKFLVIRFEDYFLPSGKKAVDLVPRSWVYYQEGSWFCRYPPENNYNFIPEWLEEEKEADSSWTSFLISIIKEAKSLLQGKRRLSKSYEKETFSSSEQDTTYEESSAKQKATEESTLQVLNADDTERILGDLPVVELVVAEPSSSGTSNTSSKNSKKRKTNNADRNPPEESQLNTENQVPVDRKYKLVTQEDLDTFYKKLKRDLKSLKSSMQQDYQNRTDTILNNLTAAGISLDSNKNLKTFCGLLPKTTLPEFIEFDESMQEGSEQLKTLTVWMTKYINCSETYNAAINKVIKSIITKTVQMEYSGCGRAVKGSKKLDFSATSSYKLMKTLIVEKFGVTEENILSKTSRWLSGAGDREGGRTARMLNSLQNPNE